MDRRGIAEAGGAAVGISGLTAGGLWLLTGRVDWVVVVGLAIGVAIAATANYRARVGHAESVAEEPPDTHRVEDHTRPTAGDGGNEIGSDNKKR